MARWIIRVQLGDPLLFKRMTALNRLWIAQTARLEWSDLAAVMVTLQQLEHGPCRDVFGVIVHDIVLKTEDATLFRFAWA